MHDVDRWHLFQGMWRRRGFQPKQPGGVIIQPPADPAFIQDWGLPTWRDEFDLRNTSGQLVLDDTKWQKWDYNNISEGTMPGTLGYLNDASIVKGRQVTVVDTTDGDTALLIKSEWMDPAEAPSLGIPGVPTVRNSGPVKPQTFSWFKTGYIDQRNINNGNRQQYGRWEMMLWMPVIPDHGLGMLWAFWFRNGSAGEWDVCETWGSGPTAAGLVPATDDDSNPYPRAAQPKPNAGTTTNTVHRDTAPPTSWVDTGGVIGPPGATYQTGATEKLAHTHTQNPPLPGNWHKLVAIWTPTVFEISWDNVVKTKFVRTPNRVSPDPANPTHWNTPAAAKYPIARLDPDGIQKDLWTAPTLRSPWYMRMNVHPGPSGTSVGVPDPSNRDWTWNSDFMCKYARRWDYSQFTGTGY